MTHANRSRRKANKTARKRAELRQKPLPLAEQLKRAKEHAELHRRFYPVPPNYRPAHNAHQPDQPVCYQRSL